MDKTSRTPELVDPLRGYKPCPFCGGDDLTTTEWWDDDGEFEAVACKNCKAEAPASTWNTRTVWPVDKIELQDPEAIDGIQDF